MWATGVFAAAALAAVLALVPVAARAEPPLGCEDFSSHMLEPIDSGLGLFVYRCDEGDAWIVSLEFLTSHDEYGHAKWEALDSIDVRSIGESDEIASGTCARDDVPDPDIVAVVYRIAPDDTGDVHRAWFADRSVGRLWPTSIDRVSCAPVLDHCGMMGDEGDEVTEASDDDAE